MSRLLVWQSLAVALAVALLTASAPANPTAPSPHPSQTASHPPTQPARANVLLISIDTLRADHLGCYGYKEISTPTIDALARDGVLFPMAISQVPLTLPEHVAILTGTYPFHNHVQDFTAPPLAEKFRTLAQAFHDHGFATGAVVSSFVLDRSWGLGRGFDSYDDSFDPRSFADRNPGLVERRAEPSVNLSIKWLARHRAQPFFFWLHLYDPHSPYEPPEPFRTRYRDRPYDGEIAYTDSQLRRLIAWLKANGLYARTWIVLLSDHGESLGEHGEQEHGFFVYNATVHVPLIIKPAAGSSLKLQPTPAPVETIAVAPTLLEMAAITDPIQQQFDSPGLFARDSGRTPTGAYSETFYPFSSFGWSPLHALETDKHHYIEAPSSELYHLPDDPRETKNIVSDQNAVSAVLQSQLRQRWQVPGSETASECPTQAKLGWECDAASKLSPEAQEKLRALGYFAYRAPAAATVGRQPLPDPKDRLEEFNAILGAGDALESQHYAEAEELLAQLRQRDPNLYVVPYLEGEVALREQHAAKAVESFQDCLKLAPNFDQAMTGLARALVHLGAAPQAESWVKKALEYNPKNYGAWYQLAQIQVKSDRPAAISALETAVSIQPNFALAKRELGKLYLDDKQYGKAAAELEAAIALGLKEAPLYNYLGIAYSQTGRQDKAIASYRAALKLDPALAEAHLNLGFAYEKLNRQHEARQEYAAACRLSQPMCDLIRSRQR
jgi:arylsulfatase A-like enzyme/Tfp pilus assembly protein PilF